MKIWKYLEMAGNYADRQYPDVRAHCLGAVGLRTDQAVVKARNGFSRFKEPRCHAEARLLRKLDVGATVFVARIRKNGDVALASPCSSCLLGLIMKRVNKVYFTTDVPGQYGCWDIKRMMEIYKG